MLDQGNTFYLISLCILITCLQENMDIIARNEIYITSGSWRLIKGITEEPTHCATSSVIIFSSKTFFFNLFTWPPLCIASSCAKLAEAEMKQYSSLWEHQSELSCHNPSPNARGLILSRRQRIACVKALMMKTCLQVKPLHKGQLSTMATAFCPKMFTMERFDSILSDHN